MEENDIVKRTFQELKDAYQKVLSEKKQLEKENKKLKTLYYNEKHKRLLPNAPNHSRRSC